MFYLALAAVNFLIYISLFSSRTTLQRLGSYKFTFFLICSLILTISQIELFLRFKDPNLYDLHHKPRHNFEHLSLDETEASKPRIPANARPNSTDSLGNYVLGYRGLQLYYDRYGDDFIEALQKFNQWGKVKYLVIEKSSIESIGFYFGAMLISVYFSLRYKSNGLKRWCATIILACFFQELEIILGDEVKEGILGLYIPNLAGFERVKLFKIAVVCIANALRAYYAYFKKSKLYKLEKVYGYVSSFNSYLNGLVGENPKETNGIVSAVKQVKENTEKVGNYVESEKKSKEEQRSSTKSPNKIIALFLVIAAVYYLPPAQEYLFNGIRYEAFTAEDYIKL